MPLNKDIPLNSSRKLGILGNRFLTEQEVERNLNLTRHVNVGVSLSTGVTYRHNHPHKNYLVKFLP